MTTQTCERGTFSGRRLIGITRRRNASIADARYATACQHSNRTGLVCNVAACSSRTCNAARPCTGCGPCHMRITNTSRTHQHTQRPHAPRPSVRFNPPKKKGGLCDHRSKEGRAAHSLFKALLFKTCVWRRGRRGRGGGRRIRIRHRALVDLASPRARPSTRWRRQRGWLQGQAPRSEITVQINTFSNQRTEMKICRNQHVQRAV